MITLVEYGAGCLYEDTNFCSVLIFVFSTFSEMLRKELLSVCQAYAESHGNIFNCSKTVGMMFKAETESAKSTVTPLDR